MPFIQLYSFLLYLLLKHKKKYFIFFTLILQNCEQCTGFISAGDEIFVFTLNEIPKTVGRYAPYG